MSATQRIHLNPNAPRGPVSGGYTPAASAYRPNSGPTIGAQGGNEVLGQVQALSSKVEDYIEAYTQVSRCERNTRMLPALTPYTVAMDRTDPAAYPTLHSGNGAIPHRRDVPRRWVVCLPFA